MKRVTNAVVASLIAATPVSAAQYGWSISASQSDPRVQTGGVAVGVASLYLWYECNLDDGMSTAEFGVQYSGNIIPLAFNAMNGFANAGTATNLLLYVGGCPAAPIVAGQLLVLYNGGPASACIVPSIAGGRNTVDCTPAAWPIRAVGWDALSPPACNDSVPGGPLCGLGCHGDFCVDGFCQTVYCVVCGICPPCDASCPPVSVSPTDWGRVKSFYR